MLNLQDMLGTWNLRSTSTFLECPHFLSSVYVNMKECVWVYFDLTVYPVASVIFHLFMVLGGQMHVHCHHDYPHVLHCLLASAYEIHSSRSSIVFGE